MNPFLQRKSKRQRTGPVQDLAEGRKHVGLACVLECGRPLPLSDERLMESLNSIRIGLSFKSKCIALAVRYGKYC